MSEYYKFDQFDASRVSQIEDIPFAKSENAKNIERKYMHTCATVVLMTIAVVSKKDGTTRHVSALRMTHLTPGKVEHSYTVMRSPIGGGMQISNEDNWEYYLLRAAWRIQHETD